jgi:DtxR family Mn-dependent transcriptional regulator
MEMYLKTIYEIGDEGRTPRVKAIADQLGVTMPSVSGAIETLQSLGLVEHTPYAAVKLTRKGEQAAREVKNRHIVLQQFLRDILKLPDEIAERDACEMEHIVSPQTLQHVQLFLEFTQVCRRSPDEMIAHFAEWLDCRENDAECDACKREGAGPTCAS